MKRAGLVVGLLVVTTLTSTAAWAKPKATPSKSLQWLKWPKREKTGPMAKVTWASRYGIGSMMWTTLALGACRTMSDMRILLPSRVGKSDLSYLDAKLVRTLNGMAVQALPGLWTGIYAGAVTETHRKKAEAELKAVWKALIGVLEVMKDFGDRVLKHAPARYQTKAVHALVAETKSRYRKAKKLAATLDRLLESEPAPYD